jgi:hypothetical protein
MKRPHFVDLADLKEDQRIAIIGATVIRDRKTVAIVVDDDSRKVERYIAKLLRKFPTIQILRRVAGPVPGSVTIKVGPPRADA